MDPLTPFSAWLGWLWLSGWQNAANAKASLEQSNTHLQKEALHWGHDFGFGGVSQKMVAWFPVLTCWVIMVK